MTAKIALSALALVLPPLAHAATNYPTNQNIGTQTGLVALYDYDDHVNGRLPTMTPGTGGLMSFQALQFVHLLPDRVAPGVDRDSGDYDFNFLPVLESDGFTAKELIVDFSLVTQLSPEASSQAKLLFPNATFFYPMATSGNLNVLQSTPGVTAEFAGSGTALLTTLGLGEPVRLHLDRKALRNYRCAVEAIDLINRVEARTGRHGNLQEDSLSVLVGVLQQDYKVLSIDPVTGAATTDKLAHTLKVGLKGKEQRDFTLAALILETVKGFAPPCQLDDGGDIATQVAMPAWPAIVAAARAEHIDLSNLD
jgi:hypothetical protein